MLNIITSAVLAASLSTHATECPECGDSGGTTSSVAHDVCVIIAAAYCRDQFHNVPATMFPVPMSIDEMCEDIAERYCDVLFPEPEEPENPKDGDGPVFELDEQDFATWACLAEEAMCGHW